MGREAHGVDALQPGMRFADRYLLEGRIGRGGYGVVYRVWDELGERPLALKCLSRRSGGPLHPRLLQAFQREYALLKQLVHPNVVRAYEFYRHGDTHAYTMELLEGVSIRRTGPLPHTAVAELLTTLGGVLSMLHARRWVHRDLSPRNVIRLPDGSLKLIDFGAAVAMMEHHFPMGTPPCTPPEVLDQQTLDARADVFGLGALSYFALTGNHAYPARSLARLQGHWQRVPVRPRERGVAVPEALDQLIMDMLALDRDARPRTMAEVHQRLVGITGGLTEGGVSMTKPYLEIPRLIGRSWHLRRAHGALYSALSGRARLCCIAGEAGSGRTRMLDAIAVAARIEGFSVARIDGKGAGNSPLSMASALVQAMRLGRRSSHRRVLSPRRPGAGCGSAPELRRAVEQVQQSLLDDALAELRRRPTALLVDEPEAADAASRRWLAQLMASVEDRPAILVMTCHRAGLARDGALSRLAERALWLPLAPFDEAEVEQWARSVFGDVSNVRHLGRWLFGVSGGLPAACMALSEHLIDQGIVQLTRAGFQLPDVLEEHALPSGVREVVHARLQRLSKSAQKLLFLLASEVAPLPRPVQDYAERFCAPGEAAVVLSELVAERVLSSGADGYRVRHRGALGWVRTANCELDDETAHSLLAEWHARAAPDDAVARVRACYHLFQAGRLAQADALLGDGGDQLQAVWDGSGEEFNRTEQGIAFYEALLSYRKQQGRPTPELYPLRLTLVYLSALVRPSLVHHADATFAALCHDVGLDLWDELTGEDDPQLQALACLRAASERRAAQPPHLRGMPPLEAIRCLGTTAVVMTAVALAHYDPRRLMRVSMALNRLRSLSPALALIADNAETTTIALRFSADLKPKLITAVSTCEHPVPGLDEAVRTRMESYLRHQLALDLASEGSDLSLQVVEPLSADPQLAGLVLSVRAQHAWMTGRYEASVRYAREREIAPLDGRFAEASRGANLLRSVPASILAADLLTLSRAAEQLRRRAASLPGYRPWASLAQGALHRELGQQEEARVLLERELAAVQPGSHGAWGYLAIELIEVLISLGEPAAAAAWALRAPEGGGPFPFSTMAEARRQAGLSLAEAGLGDYEQACERMQALFAVLAQAPGQRSLVYARACEARCRIALAMDDAEAFDAHRAALQDLYREHSGLRSRLTRLERDGVRYMSEGLHTGARRPSRLPQAYGTPIEAAQHPDHLLGLVLDATQRRRGQLYRVDDAGQPILLASRPRAGAGRLLRLARRACAAFLMADSAGRTCTGPGSEPTDVAALSHATIYLQDPEAPDRLEGLLLLSSPEPQAPKLGPGVRATLLACLRRAATA